MWPWMQNQNAHTWRIMFDMKLIHFCQGKRAFRKNILWGRKPKNVLCWRFTSAYTFACWNLVYLAREWKARAKKLMRVGLGKRNKVRLSLKYQWLDLAWVCQKMALRAHFLRRWSLAKNQNFALMQLINSSFPFRYQTTRKDFLKEVRVHEVRR